MKNVISKTKISQWKAPPTDYTWWKNIKIEEKVEKLIYSDNSVVTKKNLMTTIVKTHGTWLQGQNLQNCAIKEGANDIKHNQWNYNQKKSNLRKEIYIQVWVVFRILFRHNQKTAFPCHIIAKILSAKNKEILKAAREKCQVTYKSKPIRIIADFSAETLKAKRTWIDVFRMLRTNNFKARLYLAKLSFKMKGERKTFRGK